MKSLLDETLATIPSTTWDDIYGIGYMKNELRTLIRRPMSQKKVRKEMRDPSLEGMIIPEGVPPEGLLMCAPRGFGKTLLIIWDEYISLSNYYLLTRTCGQNMHT